MKRKACAGWNTQMTLCFRTVSFRIQKRSNNRLVFSEKLPFCLSLCERKDEHSLHCYTILRILFT